MSFNNDFFFHKQMAHIYACVKKLQMYIIDTDQM